MSHPIYRVCNYIVERGRDHMPSTHAEWDRWEHRQTWGLGLTTVGLGAVGIWSTVTVHPFIGWGFLVSMGVATGLVGFATVVWPRDYRRRAEPFFVIDSSDE